MTWLHFFEWLQTNSFVLKTATFGTEPVLLEKLALSGANSHVSSCHQRHFKHFPTKISLQTKIFLIIRSNFCHCEQSVCFSRAKQRAKLIIYWRAVELLRKQNWSLNFAPAGSSFCGWREVRSARRLATNTAKRNSECVGFKTACVGVVFSLFGFADRVTHGEKERWIRRPRRRYGRSRLLTNLNARPSWELRVETEVSAQSGAVRDCTLGSRCEDYSKRKRLPLSFALLCENLTTRIIYNLNKWITEFP